jgi:hypothetical protein
MARQGDNYYLVITDTVDEDSGIIMANAANDDGEAKSYGRLTVNQQTASSNAASEEASSTIRQLNVEHASNVVSSSKGQPPEFKKLFYDKHVMEGDDIRLDAVILGSPKPKVKFKKYFMTLFFLLHMTGC